MPEAEFGGVCREPELSIRQLVDAFPKADVAKDRIESAPVIGFSFLHPALSARASPSFHIRQLAAEEIRRQVAPMRWLLVPVALLILPSVARADPFEGQRPFRQGETLSGVIRYTGDRDSLCLGPPRDIMTWIEVRRSDFDAPEHKASGGRDARDLLSRTVRGRMLACVAVRGRNGRVIVQDRVVGTCRLNGHGVGDLLRASDGRDGGR